MHSQLTQPKAKTDGQDIPTGNNRSLEVARVEEQRPTVDPGYHIAYLQEARLNTPLTELGAPPVWQTCWKRWVPFSFVMCCSSLARS